MGVARRVLTCICDGLEGAELMRGDVADSKRGVSLREEAWWEKVGTEHSFRMHGIGGKLEDNGLAGRN